MTMCPRISLRAQSHGSRHHRQVANSLANPYPTNAFITAVARFPVLISLAFLRRSSLRRWLPQLVLVPVCPSFRRPQDYNLSTPLFLFSIRVLRRFRLRAHLRTLAILINYATFPSSRLLCIFPPPSMPRLGCPSLTRCRPPPRPTGRQGYYYNYAGKDCHWMKELITIPVSAQAAVVPSANKTMPADRRGGRCRCPSLPHMGITEVDF